MVGADLRNLANEAALAAARRDATTVSQADFSDALEKVELGSERKLSLTALDREKIAYHESGHALLGLLQPGADPVRRVSIIPRGQSLGATVQSPVDDRFSYGEDYLRGRITGALGGRAAEELVYGIVTTGAESDLRQVTAIARQMVVKWGMSPKVGVLSLADDDGPGQPLSLSRPYSEETAALIDNEVRRICEECLRQAVALLTANRDKLDALAKALLEHDTLGESRDPCGHGNRGPGGGSNALTRDVARSPEEIDLRIDAPGETCTAWAFVRPLIELGGATCMRKRWLPAPTWRPRQ